MREAVSASFFIVVLTAAPIGTYSIYRNIREHSPLQHFSLLAKEFTDVFCLGMLTFKIDITLSIRSNIMKKELTLEEIERRMDEINRRPAVVLTPEEEASLAAAEAMDDGTTIEWEELKAKLECI